MTLFIVKLADIGDKKINLIRELREQYPCGLKQAKDAIESGIIVGHDRIIEAVNMLTYSYQRVHGYEQKPMLMLKQRASINEPVPIEHITDTSR